MGVRSSTMHDAWKDTDRGVGRSSMTGHPRSYTLGPGYTYMHVPALQIIDPITSRNKRSRELFREGPIIAGSLDGKSSPMVLRGEMGVISYCHRNVQANATHKPLLLRGSSATGIEGGHVVHHRPSDPAHASRSQPCIGIGPCLRNAWEL